MDIKLSYKDKLTCRICNHFGNCQRNYIPATPAPSCEDAMNSTNRVLAFMGLNEDQLKEANKPNSKLVVQCADQTFPRMGIGKFEDLVKKAGFVKVVSPEPPKE
jgi:hypothetical protein